MNLHQIKDTLKPYRFDYVDCFEHPVAVVCNYLRPRSNYLYILYQKLYQTFGYDAVKSGIYSFETELGIRCNKIEVTDLLISELERLLSLGHPVLVTGNHREVFYASKYKREDWPHLFLIKGFDRERRLFYMLDNLQLTNQDEACNYSEFPIEYDALIRVYDSFEVFDKKYILYHEVVEDGKSEIERFIIFLKSLHDSIQLGESFEQFILKFVRENQKQLEDSKEIELQREVLNIPKHKVVLLEQLICYMQELEYDVSKLMELKKPLEEAWTLDNLVLVRYLKKARYEKMVTFSCEKTRAYEQELLHEIDNCITYLNAWDTRKENSLAFNYENNQDAIISRKDDEYTFYFHNGKTYNTWLSDECPKVILWNGFGKNNDFFIQVKCSVIEPNANVGHLEGIFVRTSTNKMYSFGMNHEDKYIFDWVGKIMIGMYESVQGERTANLYMEEREQFLSVGVILDGQKAEFGKIKLSEEIVQIGLLCKTWDECKALNVSFSECVLEQDKDIK